MSTALREIIGKFDVDAGPAKKGLADLNSWMNKASGALSGLASAFVGSTMVSGLGNFIDSNIEAAAAIADSAERLGVTTDLLQKFGFMAEQSGTSAESLAQGMMFLNRSMADVADGAANADAPFKRLGVSAVDASGHLRSVEDLLPELADGFANLQSPQERTRIAMDLFGRSGASLIPLLKDGSKGINALAGEFKALGGGMSRDFIAKAKASSDATAKFKFGLQNLKSQMVMAILPSLDKFKATGIKMVEGLIKLGKETYIAKEAMGLLGIGAAAAIAKVGISIAKLVGLVPKGAGLMESLLGLGEIGLAIIAVGALFLIFDDLFNFMQGNDSVIGSLITQFLGFDQATETAKKLNEAWQEVKQTFVDLGPSLKEATKELGDAGEDSLPTITAAFVVLLKVLAEVVEDLAKIEAYLIKKGLLTKVAGFLSGGMIGVNGAEAVSSGLEYERLTHGKGHTKRNQYVGDAPEVDVSSLPAATAATGPHQVSQHVDIGGITVNGGATNADTGKTIAAAIEKAFSQQDMNNAMNAFPPRGPQ